MVTFLSFILYALKFEKKTKTVLYTYILIIMYVNWMDGVIKNVFIFNNRILKSEEGNYQKNVSFCGQFLLE